MDQHIGELTAILTAVFWTVTALVFESAGKKVGSLAVNWIRLVLAFFFIGTYNWISRGYFFPTDASWFNWQWLAISGIFGFVIGDLMLFQSYVIIGARVASLLMALAPPFSALFSWWLLGEVMRPLCWVGMGVTLLGIVITIVERDRQAGGSLRNTFRSKYSIPGIILGIGGALGQGVGLVLSKKGMGNYNAFSASQIRIFTGVVGFTILFFALRKWPVVGAAIKNPAAIKRIATGAFFGPFLGVSFSLIAVQHTQAGVAATLMAIVPVLIILPSILFLKQTVNWKEILGAGITVGGVALFFL